MLLSPKGIGEVEELGISLQIAERKEWAVDSEPVW